METIQDFEDLLIVLNKHKVRYLIIGGLAFIFHAKPRYTKDMDLWVESTPLNITNVNAALREFGSPYLLNPNMPGEILQIGVEPDRIDIHQSIPGVRFTTVWKKRIVDKYGEVETNWMDIDSLIRVKQGIDHPRHREDVRILRQVKKMSKKRSS